MYLLAVVHRPQVVVHPRNTQQRCPWLGEGPAGLCRIPNTSPPAAQVGWHHPQLGAASPSRGDRSNANPKSHQPLPTWLLCPYRTHKPWPVIQMHATQLSSPVFMVAVVALGTKYHGGQVIVNTVSIPGYLIGHRPS